MMDKSIETFLGFTRAGLWENGGNNINHDLNVNEDLDWAKVYQLAQEQSVQGLVLQGMEAVRNNIGDINPNIPHVLLLQWIGEVQMIEQQNKSMNEFIAGLIDKLRETDVYAILVKGQGIAQCYERPLWRVLGDVDLLLSDSNYQKAKDFLLPLSTDNKPNERYSKHLGMSIDSWYVEIHGSLRTGLSGRVDKVVDAVQKDVFYNGNVRSWNNGNTQVFLPAPDNDVFFVFTHFIKHFYKEGMNLRQICDWCRLLWTFRETLNNGLLESRIRKVGLLAEWKAFAALAVDYLGTPAEVMPLYSDDVKWKKKAEKILPFILKGGEWRKVYDTITVGKIFPMSVLRFAPGILLNVNWLKIKERIFGA